VTDKLTQLPPESTLSNVKQPVDVMIDEVAGLIGGSTDPASRTKATRALDRAADWMNMSGVYMYRRKTYTTESVTADQTQIETPGDWGWPEDVPRVYNASGDIVGRMEWLDWEPFKSLQADGDPTSSVPSYASIRSELDEIIHIYPAIDTNNVSEIQFDYLARIQRVSENTEIYALPETREALICGGEAFAMRFHYASRPRIWEPFWMHFTKAIRNAKATSWRFRQVVHTNATPGESGKVWSGADTRKVFISL
jgi:hypothetical protein